MATQSVIFHRCDICNEFGRSTTGNGIEISNGVTIGIVGIGSFCLRCIRDAHLEFVDDVQYQSQCRSYYLVNQRGRALAGRLFGSQSDKKPSPSSIKQLEGHYRAEIKNFVSRHKTSAA